MTPDDAELVMDAIVQLYDKWLPTPQQRKACLSTLRRFRGLDIADEMTDIVRDYYALNTARRIPRLGDILTLYQTRSDPVRRDRYEQQGNPNRLWTTPYYVICVAQDGQGKGNIGDFKELTLPKPWPAQHLLEAQARALKAERDDVPSWMGGGGVWEVVKSETALLSDEQPDSYYRHQVLLHRRRLMEECGSWQERIRLDELDQKNRAGRLPPGISQAAQQAIMRSSPKVHAVADALPQRAADVPKMDEEPQQQQDIDIAAPPPAARDSEIPF